MLSERLRLAMDEAGMSQAELARKVGVKAPSINGWLSGKAKFLRGENLLAAARALKVSQDWLATGKGSMRPAADADASLRQANTDEASAAIDLRDNADYPAVRRVRFKLSAGASGFAVEYLDDDDAPIVFRRQWFENNGYRPEKLFATRIANGSMEPGLYDGDTVVVNTDQTRAKDGIVFAVNYEGELVVKRLVRDAGQWWLLSDNPDQRRYPRKLCDENVFLVGEIVHKQSERI